MESIQSNRRRAGFPLLVCALTLVTGAVQASYVNTTTGGPLRPGV
jgi:hypothetical protein